MQDPLRLLQLDSCIFNETRAVYVSAGDAETWPAHSKALENPLGCQVLESWLQISTPNWYIAHTCQTADLFSVTSVIYSSMMQEPYRDTTALPACSALSNSTSPFALYSIITHGTHTAILDNCTVAIIYFGTYHLFNSFLFSTQMSILANNPFPLLERSVGSCQFVGCLLCITTDHSSFLSTESYCAFNR